jgi:hypothetical protein
MSSWSDSRCPPGADQPPLLAFSGAGCGRFRSRRLRVRRVSHYPLSGKRVGCDDGPMGEYGVGIGDGPAGQVGGGPAGGTNPFANGSTDVGAQLGNFVNDSIHTLSTLTPIQLLLLIVVVFFGLLILRRVL